MKKIMFSERFGLEQAVLAGTKTHTRRIMIPPKKFKGKTDLMLEYHKRLTEKVYYDCVVCDADGHELGQMPLPYEVGDVVAIAQNYKRAGWEPTAVQYQEKRKNGKFYGAVDPIVITSALLDFMDDRNYLIGIYEQEERERREAEERKNAISYEEFLKQRNQ